MVAVSAVGLDFSSSGSRWPEQARIGYQTAFPDTAWSFRVGSPRCPGTCLAPGPAHSLSHATLCVRRHPWYGRHSGYRRAATEDWAGRACRSSPPWRGCSVIPIPHATKPQAPTPSRGGSRRREVARGRRLSFGDGRAIPNLINQPRERAGPPLNLPKSSPDEFRDTTGSHQVNAGVHRTCAASISSMSFSASSGRR